jgi:hypothetical protein
MKRILAFVAALSLAGGLAACEEEAEIETPEGEVEIETDS